MGQLNRARPRIEEEAPAGMALNGMSSVWNTPPARGHGCHTSRTAIAE